ncbi:hypothetical protein B9Z19DRAFT_1137955 [Tuber borchii]|uniref:RNAse P Rpr2/Rpp21/SNM1 subunit domain-domain-containing protein n=1 Tax=Tuber borchii TaxID=42251 RepID=A0A2T6ZA04_TUBBO|nr:hypothetical protein B9Z19DRAFT_1137955 [Tuber borchii]
MATKTPPRPSSSNLTTSYILRASHLLLPTAPSLSTTLLSTSPAAQTSPGLSNICKSCSAILIPGWSAHVRTLPHGKEKRKEATASKTTVVVWECQSCGGGNRFEVGKPKIKRGKGKGGGGVKKVEGGAGRERKVDRGTNQGSKARAKKRKGSLADALSKRRTDGGGGGGAGAGAGAGGFGLELMDLMKVGDV